MKWAREPMAEPPGADALLPGTAENFRTAWRGVGSSVAVIATEFEGKSHAMLATAVCSVSMEPPSLLICVNRTASAYDAIAARGAFSVGILSARNADVAKHMGSAKGEERFAGGGWSRLSMGGDRLHGLPWLRDAQATLFCVTDKVTDYGSHTIYIGLVESMVPPQPYDPLLYCDGRYRTLQDI